MYHFKFLLEAFVGMPGVRAQDGVRVPHNIPRPKLYVKECFNHCY